MSPPDDDTFVLTLVCPDRLGIVHAVSGALAEHGYNIVESQQFGDKATGRFFMRVETSAAQGSAPESEIRVALSDLGAQFDMDWAWNRSAERPRLLILVSKFGHCLNDLLYRQRVGALRVEIAAVASNHPDFEPLVRSYGIAFHHLPVSKETKAEQEGRILDLVDSLGIELVVLARYMQILTSSTAQRLAGRAINIHHGLLPSFKGSAPYNQAFERGVKVIGATAHYVTEDLDEGPIIAQGVQPVDHSMSAEQLTVIGRDIECQALARAVEWHVEHRVLMNGSRTVVFA